MGKQWDCHNYVGVSERNKNRTNPTWIRNADARWKRAGQAPLPCLEHGRLTGPVPSIEDYRSEARRQEKQRQNCVPICRQTKAGKGRALLCSIWCNRWLAYRAKQRNHLTDGQTNVRRNDQQPLIGVLTTTRRTKVYAVMLTTECLHHVSYCRESTSSEVG